jgi:hypothetical protein
MSIPYEHKTLEQWEAEEKERLNKEREQEIAWHQAQILAIKRQGYREGAPRWFTEGW